MCFWEQKTICLNPAFPSINSRISIYYGVVNWYKSSDTNNRFWEVFFKNHEPQYGHANKNKTCSQTSYSVFIFSSTPFLPSTMALKGRTPTLARLSSTLSPFHCILTIIKVNVLWDLVPGAVVEMADLFLILHHACWFAFLLVFQGNVVLDSFKVLPMLKNK